ncbi:MAG TPA: transposase [Candidatus Limnocylindrales bacterium]|nr:transposase [Candidatus Limnocylindrales bacterium]
MHNRPTQEMAAILIEIDRHLTTGRSLASAATEAGISTATYYRWRRLLLGVSKDGVGRVRDLERENLRLRRIVTDKLLEIEFLRELSRGTY